MDTSQTLPGSSEVLDSLWLANSSPSFQGSASTMVINYDEKVREESGSEELFDACFHQPEKKRRLLPDQVQFLERSFEVENKLEPERKVHLAKELGLQPRQVAIWFQNRRARYKNKQLEQDYDLLKSNYDKLKSDYESLFKENSKLKNEVCLLNGKMNIMENGGEVKPGTFDDDSIMNVDGESKQVISNVVLDNVTSSGAPNVLGCKQEDASSAKSDVFDSDSPHYTDDSSNIFHEDEIDNSLCQSLLCAPSFLKLEDDCYDDLQPNPSILESNGEDEGTWFWNY